MPKPANLLYGVNDTPPLGTLIILGLQHAILMTMVLIFPIVIIQVAHGSAVDLTHMTQAVMLFMGIGTILLSFNKRYFGAGYFVCAIFDPAYISVSILASKLGGLPLLYLINYIQGILQTIFAGLLIPLRKLFPPEITGLVILMIGLSIISLGITNAIGGVDHLHHLRWDSHSCIISSLTLVVMIAITVWGGKYFARYGLMIGLIVGLLLSGWLGLFKGASTRIDVTHLFSLPHFAHLKLNVWHWDMLVPMIVAVISVSLKAMGGLVTEQKINDTDWVRTDIKEIRKGLATVGASGFIASIFGGMPMGISSANVGLSITTRVTSRKIAYAVGIIYIVLSFFPAVSALFVLLPKPVIGAILIFVIASIVVAGVQVMLSRMIDARKMFVIGIPIVIGLAFQFIPQLQIDVPKGMQPIVASPLTTSTILAIILNLVFQIGLKKSSSFTITLDDDAVLNVNQKIHHLGSNWGAVPMAMHRVRKAFDDILHALKYCNLNSKEITISLSYDEYKLVGALIYDGAPIKVQLEEMIAQKDNPNKHVMQVAYHSFSSHVDTSKVLQHDDKHKIEFVINQ